MTAMKSRRLVWGLWGALLLAVGLWWGLTGSGSVLAKEVRPPVEPPVQPAVEWEALARRYGIAGESGLQRSLNVDSGYDWHTFYPFGMRDTYSLWSYGMAVDEAGNVYLAGAVNWAWTENGAMPLHSYSGAKDIAIIKLNSAGIYQWHTYYGGAWNDKATSLVTDADGNLYITGYSESSWNGDGDTAPLHPYSSARADMFVLKLNSAGVYQWHTFYGGTVDDDASSIKLSGSNDLVVVGTSYGMTTTWMGDGNTAPLHSAGMAWMLKLTRAGGYLWHTFYGYYAYDVAVAANGDLYVAEEGCGWLGDNDAAPLHSCSGGTDWAVLKLNGAGAYQWHTFYGSAQYDTFGLSARIALDPNGGVYFTGASRGNWSGDGGVPPLHPYENSISLGVLKLNTAGAYQWHTFYGEKQPNGGIIFGSALAVDAEGGVYVGGGNGGLPWQGDQGADPILIGHGAGSVLLKLDSQGRYRWHLFYGGLVPQILQPKGSAIYVAGMSSSWTGPEGIAPIHPAEPMTGCTSSCYHLYAMKLRNLPRATMGITATETKLAPGEGTLVTAWVSAETPMPTGVVTFTVNDSFVATRTLTLEGVVTYAMSALSVGEYTVTAEYGGYEGVLGSRASVRIDAKNEAAIQTVFSPTAVFVTKAMVYTATVTDREIPTKVLTGSVKFAFRTAYSYGETNLPLDQNGRAVFTYTSGVSGFREGPIVVTTTYLGNEEYYSVSNWVTGTILKAPPVISLTVQPLTVTLGGRGYYWVRVLSSISSMPYYPSGVVTFEIPGITLMTNTVQEGGAFLCWVDYGGAGSYPINVKYSGNDWFQNGEIQSNQIVEKSPMIMTLTTNLLTPTVGDWVDYTATLGTSVPRFRPSGVLTLQVGHQAPMTQVVGSATSYIYRVQAVAGGLQTITATYSGDQNFSESQTHTFQTVLKLATALTVTGPTTVTAGQPAVLTARVQPTATGVVSWSVPGRPAVTGTLDANSVATGTLVLPAAGHYSVTVTYGGDAIYAGSAAQHELAVWARLYLPLVLKTGQQEMKR